MSERRFCTGCLRDDENNEADAWCSDCLDEVCKACAKEHTRFNPQHKIIPLHQASNPSSSILKISTDCGIHTDQRTVLNCTQHDKISCDLCLSDTHRNFVIIDKDCFASEKRLLLSSSNATDIYVCGYDGNDVHRIKSEHNPYSVAIIDNKSVIVALMYEWLQFLDLTTLTLGKCFKPGGDGCHAVTWSNGQIWRCDTSRSRGIDVDDKGNV
ncbi:unnamed protein product [Mytilus coruscus]|uniref:B box-type domain-containing protein n=1 Tax=Mytilus coruscus TaxID=42192 RepID=A0A6J8A5C2_MYTCO|nr:unnamed protein product [Mytilus coruscus]